ncbi:hypothetical protein [Parasediminibacterium sp. JCM 36343]|uniref:hypothetical protein n=1 Tax=Parasediminibacterium sp. JCM 36343 TaxID=3374279 RepID=UPI00397DBDB6
MQIKKGLIKKFRDIAIMAFTVLLFSLVFCGGVKAQDDGPLDPPPDGSSDVPFDGTAGLTLLVGVVVLYGIVKIRRNNKIFEI